MKTKPKPKTKPKAKPAKAKPAPTPHAESAAWCRARALTTTGKPRWYVRIALDVVDEPASEVYWGSTATRFHLDIFADEWGVMFVHGGKTSHVRKTDHVFVNGGDAHGLERKLPALAEVGKLLRSLEAEHGVAFKRQHAFIRTNLAGAKKVVAAWLTTL